MSRKRKINMGLIDLNAPKPPASKIIMMGVKCGGCGKEVILEVDKHFTSWDFSFGSSPCELCGSHGNLDFDFKCPECNWVETISIKEW